MFDDGTAGITRVIAAHGGCLRAADANAVVDTFGLDRTFHVESVLAAGDVTTVRTSSTGTVTLRAAGDVMPVGVRELFVLGRVDGEWRIAQHMFQQMP